IYFFFSSRRRHTRFSRDWSSDVCSSDLIPSLIDFHHQHGKLATVTAVQPPGRFGALDLQGEQVRGFQEKPLGDGGWINGGFFVRSEERRVGKEWRFRLWTEHLTNRNKKS